MLVRTEMRSLRESGNEALSSSFIDGLERYGLLILPFNFFRSRPDGMPERLWEILWELRKAGRLNYRLAPDDFIGVTSPNPPWPVGSPFRVEVVVSGKEDPVPDGCKRVPPADFHLTERVGRIRDLIEGSAFVEDRSDLWRTYVEPLLDSLRGESRNITISDRYSAGHLLDFRTGKRDSHGLGWLLSRINENAKLNRTKDEVILYSLVKSHHDEQVLAGSLAAITNGLDRVKVVLRLIPEQRIKFRNQVLFRAIHQRFLLVGSAKGLILDSGLDSLSVRRILGDDKPIADLTFASEPRYCRDLGRVKNEPIKRIINEEFVGVEIVGQAGRIGRR